MNKLVKNMMALFLFSVQVFALDGTWEERSSMPEPRSGHAAAAINHTIYISGGRSSHSGMHALHAELWAYNTQTDTWNSNLPALNEPREGHVMVAIGDTLWVFGGRRHNNVVPEVNYWVVGSESWQMSSMMPVPRSGMGSYVRNGKVYLIGGKTSGSTWALPTTRVDLFDPQTEQWATEDSLGQARVDFAVVTNGDTTLCVGGRFLDPLASVEHRIQNENWEYTNPLLVPRGNCAAVYFQDQFILLGGVTAGGQADNNLVFDGSNWNDFSLNLLPRYNMAALAVDNGIYLLGGRNGGQILSSVERFMSTVGTQDWSPLPVEATMTAYPNPFNGNVVLELSLPENADGEQTLTIFNALGQQVYRSMIASHSIVASVRIPDDALGTSGLYVAVLSYKLSNGVHRQITTKLIALK